MWKAHGLNNVYIRDESVWGKVKENIEIEDRGDKLGLYGDFDSQAIGLMVLYDRET